MSRSRILSYATYILNIIYTYENICADKMRNREIAQILWFQKIYFQELCLSSSQTGYLRRMIFETAVEGFKKCCWEDMSLMTERHTCVIYKSSRSHKTVLRRMAFLSAVAGGFICAGQDCRIYFVSLYRDFRADLKNPSTPHQFSK